MATERYFADATAEQIGAAAAACRRAATANDDDWGAPEAEEARRLTADLDWAWDFITWTHAATVLDNEWHLARMKDAAKITALHGERDEYAVDR
jgi:hypothetical protein